MNLDEFSQDFIRDIRLNSQIERDTPSNVFLNQMVQRLEEMSVLFNTNIYSFSKIGQKKKMMRVDGFSFDEADKSLILLLNDFEDKDNPSTLNQSTINDLIQIMTQFVVELSRGTIFEYIDDGLVEFKNYLRSIYNRMKIDYVSDTEDPVDKVKFVILTNKKLSNRKINVVINELESKKVEVNIWDITRIFELIQSGKEREPLEVDFNNYNLTNGIPFIKAEFKNNDLYDAFMCIIPGKVLSDIYFDHGSRLLEGNIRTFLSTRGKINKNIRKTIKEEPNKFFAYNNGVSCTASEIKFSTDGKYILKIGDLQIINGGQTTASLTSAEKKDKASLELIYVPMKLTLIKEKKALSDENKTNTYEEMIQNIAKYANSQNKIKDSDFFSNHPFHRQMELLSKQLPANPKKGEFHGSYWFYERSRGAYEQQQYKIKTIAEKNDFLRKFPKNQVIKKEELAKYMMAGFYLRPDFVSKGSEKNMIEFASYIDDLWTNSSSSINDHFYKEAVAYAILYKTLDKLVTDAPWYYVGGPKLNIIPYTISKFFYSIPKGTNLDLLKIWDKQELSFEMQKELLRIAKVTLDFINKSNGILVTEYAKKAETWEKYKIMEETITTDLADDLISDKLLQGQKHIAKKEKIVMNTLEIEKQIMELAQRDNGQYWINLINEARKRKIWTPTLDSIFTVVAELAKVNPKRFPSSEQMKKAWELRGKMEEAGVLV